jgi:UDP-N-acetylglucosamine:LPS N-acetylglucosamine transferase
VRGLPAEKVCLNQPGQSIEIVNHLSSTDFNKCLQQSKLVICRSGYTTIMDLVKLKKSAVLVPTPGQKEQEYLADFLSEKKYFVTVPQEDFSLQNILNSHKTLPVTYPDFSLETYKPVIDEFVLSLKKSNFAPQ